MNSYNKYMYIDKNNYKYISQNFLGIFVKK